MATDILKLSILGATGSVGLQALDVVRTCLPNAKICALTGYSSLETLAELANEFKPDIVSVADATDALKLGGLLNVKCEIVTGSKGLETCAAKTDANIVLNALVGRVGLAPTLSAINAGKNIAIANKETLVTAGQLVTKFAKQKKVKITPIDSEHSAIWQCLQGNNAPLEKIILTASGGPFRTWDTEKITEAKARHALRHPKWDMGAKITIDSATLMNKGLELIEAMWLFNQPQENIEILVHPQSIIHSMIQFKDGAILAQLGMPDMRLPILYALTAPKRVENTFPRLDFLTNNTLTFEAVDTKRFPCLELALTAAKQGGTLPTVMNYVNEWAVAQYLQDKIKFYDISKLIAQAFDAYTVKPITSIDDIWEAEDWARTFVRK